MLCSCTCSLSFRLAPPAAATWVALASAAVASTSASGAEPHALPLPLSCSYVLIPHAVVSRAARLYLLVGPWTQSRGLPMGAQLCHVPSDMGKCKCQYKKLSSQCQWLPFLPWGHSLQSRYPNGPFRVEYRQWGGVEPPPCKRSRKDCSAISISKSSLPESDSRMRWKACMVGVCFRNCKIKMA